MAENMMFPKDWMKFIEDYSFKDDKEVYTNGSQLVSVFRVEQMVEHYFQITSGVGFKPAIPGPSESDPNIMELCFHNGERHEKEKICMELTKIAEKMPCITVAQAIALLEGL